MAGLSFLKHFTNGNVWLIRAENNLNNVDDPFKSLRHVNVVNVPDKFPADHPGLISYNLSPLRKSECFWYVDLQDLLEMVHLLETGSYDPYRLVSVAGEALQSPEMLRVHRGVQLKDAIRMKTALPDVRFISGGIFTGRQVGYDGYLGFYANSIQVLPEGRQRHFLRWLHPGHAFHTCSRNFLSAFIPVREFSFTTGVFGEERACVQCGACERICPLGLMPSFIYKAVLAEDYDMVENLDIRDCINCGLCTYSCPSKIQLNNTLSNMLQTLKKEEE
jgi:Na+-transporting NADH:ubiquinone oxidoreductase subunit A